MRNVPNIEQMPMAVNQQMAPQQMAPQQAESGPEPLTSSMLAAANPQEQKQMLGERLFPLIQVTKPILTIFGSSKRTIAVAKFF